MASLITETAMLSNQIKKGKISEMYLKCDAIADTVENLRGWIKREFEIQAGQTGREIVGFTPVPFSYRPVLFLKTRAFFFPITHFRGCMKCSENLSKKIAKRKKGGYLIKHVKLAQVQTLPICASLSAKNSDVFLHQEMVSFITVTNLNFHQKKNVPSFERKDLSYCLDPKPLM